MPFALPPYNFGTNLLPGLGASPQYAVRGEPPPHRRVGSGARCFEGGEDAAAHPGGHIFTGGHQPRLPPHGAPSASDSHAGEQIMNNIQ
jgi:hypothetical protein